MGQRARGRAILAAGAAIQILTGIPAAWGVFRAPLLQQYAFAEEGSDLAFRLLIGAFGLGCVLGGLLQDKQGPRAAGLWGTALLAGGFGAAALLPGGRVGLFCLAFSLPAGLGSAFLAPAVMSCAQKWYTDKKGLATGVIGGAAGASGAFLTLFVRGVGGAFGLRACFGALGALMLLVCGTGSLLLKNPPPPAQRPERQGRQYKQPVLDLPPRKMLRTRQYWLCFAMVAGAAPAMLLLSPRIVQIGRERGLSEGAAHLSIVLGSVGSAAGRLACPAASDRLGRKPVCVVLLLALAGLSLLFPLASGALVVVCYTALAFFYSGQAAMLPALSSDLFGLPHAGVNYGFVALGMTAGSLASHLAAGWGLQGGLPGAGAALAGAACALALHPVEPQKAVRTRRNDVQ